MPETIEHVLWQGPLQLNEVPALKDPRQDRGLYQIYGPHYAYGEAVVLYIGKTDQTFARRVPEHGWAAYERGVHVGRLLNTENLEPSAFARRLELVEWLLIYVHGPGYNARLVKDPLPNAPIADLRVLNWGNHGSLLPEVSGLRWLTRGPRAESRPVGPREENG